MIYDQKKNTKVKQVKEQTLWIFDEIKENVKWDQAEVQVPFVFVLKLPVDKCPRGLMVHNKRLYMEYKCTKVIIVKINNGHQTI